MSTPFPYANAISLRKSSRLKFLKEYRFGDIGLRTASVVLCSNKRM